MMESDKKVKVFLFEKKKHLHDFATPTFVNFSPIK